MLFRRLPRFSAPSQKHAGGVAGNGDYKLAQPTGPRSRRTPLAHRITKTHGLNRASASPPSNIPASPRTNIPLATTSFVGREAEVTELMTALQQSTQRAVVLVGAPGCGKSRLALELGARLIDSFAEGVWWIDLAATAAAQTLPERVAAILRDEGRPEPALSQDPIHPLRASNILLILDNCDDQVAAVCEYIQRLLRVNPHIHVLATSRELLPLTGLRIWPVQPLSIPPQDSLPMHAVPSGADLPSIDSLMQSNAVRLFVERAKAIAPDFSLTERNAADVAQICRRLDGLPLAIEQAAANVRLLTPKEIVDWLDESLHVLDDPDDDVRLPSRGLWAAFDSSYRRLTEREQQLFRRLAVFEGGATFEAIRAIADTGDGHAIDVLKQLAHLVNKSLILVDQRPGQTRYDLLRPIRAFGVEQLRAEGEFDATCDAHVRFFVALAERAGPHLRAHASIEWVTRLTEEHPNIEQALQTCLETQPELALRLVGSVWKYWELRGHASSGRQWLDQALARAQVSPSLARAQALDGAAVLAQTEGDYAQARSLHEAAREMKQGLGDIAGEGFSVYSLARLARDTGLYAEAGRLFDQSLGLYQLAEDKSGLGHCLVHYGILKQLEGEYAEAIRLLDEGLTRLRSAEPSVTAALALSQRGWTLYHQGQLEEAQVWLEKAQTLQRTTLGDAAGLAYTLTYLSAIALQTGAVERAVELQEEALLIFRTQRRRQGIALALTWLGGSATHQGKSTQAMALYREALTLYQELRSPWGIASVLCAQAQTWLRLSDIKSALQLSQQSLAIRRDLPDQHGIAVCLEGLAVIAAAEGWRLAAARLDKAAYTLRQTISAPRLPLEVAELERSLTQAQSIVHEQLQTSPTSHLDLSLQEVITHALEPDMKGLELLGVGHHAALVPPLRGDWLAPELDPAMYDLRIHALGASQVYRREQLLTPADWTYAKPRELLFYLLSYPERSKEQIGVALWPEASHVQLRTALHSAMHRLRRALGQHDCVLVQNEVYSFNRRVSYWYDVEIFEAHLIEADRLKTQAPSHAIHHLRAAVALYKGDFLQHGTGGAEWVFLKRESLRHGLIQALVTLGQLLFVQRQYDQAVEVYRRAIREDSYLEVAHRELMRCYTRQGERGQALRHYQNLSQMLRRELGAAPAPETILLYERLLAGEGI